MHTIHMVLSGLENKVEFVSYNMSQLSNGKVKWFGIDNSYMYIMICYGIVAIIEC